MLLTTRYFNFIDVTNTNLWTPTLAVDPNLATKHMVLHIAIGKAILPSLLTSVCIKYIVATKTEGNHRNVLDSCFYLKIYR